MSKRLKLGATLVALVALVALVTSCVSGGYYGAGTLIGLNVGTPEGYGFTIGYQKYEACVCGPDSGIGVDLVENIGPEGIARKQVLSLGLQALEE